MRTARLLLIVLVVGLVLTSCAPKVPIAMRLSAGTTVKLSASYSRYSGTKAQALMLEQGEPVSISYRLEVESGAMRLSIVDPQENEIWQRRFVESAEDVFTFTTGADGDYLIKIANESAQGSYELVCKNTGS